MACTQERASQISDFALGHLADSEAHELLAHLERCPECSRYFDVVSGIASLASTHGEVLFGEGGEPLCTRILGRIRDLMQPKRSNLRIWVPAAASAVLLVTLLLPTFEADDIARLADVDKPAYVPTLIRSEGIGKIEAQFREGMEAYQQDDFQTCARVLARVVREKPNHRVAVFYLGVSLLLDGKAEDAIPFLERAAEGSEGILHERSLWYLANAYLKTRDGVSAEKALERVLETAGSYRGQAQAILDSLPSGAAR